MVFITLQVGFAGVELSISVNTSGVRDVRRSLAILHPWIKYISESIAQQVES